MKFLADMGISPKTVRYLGDSGHDAVHLHEQGLDTLSDAEIVEKARIENRIILTFDLDFGDLMAASKAKTPSVIIFRLRNMKPINVNNFLHEILISQENTLHQGAIISVTEKQARVRRLPIS